MLEAEGIKIVLQIHTEETEYRVEPVLASAVSRRRFLAGFRRRDVP